MRQIVPTGDERVLGACLYSGANPETRDHVPSRVLLDLYMYVRGVVRNARAVTRTLNTSPARSATMRHARTREVPSQHPAPRAPHFGDGTPSNAQGEQQQPAAGGAQASGWTTRRGSDRYRPTARDRAIVSWLRLLDCLECPTQLAERSVSQDAHVPWRNPERSCNLGTVTFLERHHHHLLLERVEHFVEEPR